ncbi:ATP-dependent DNA helicase [Microbacterium sediminicola]|uniref:DNA 3'-5' helicase n=1 Tax=Microbacterium sediminicola TaxID=415210 RepID=A0ABP4TNY8_9MICO
MSENDAPPQMLFSARRIAQILELPEPTLDQQRVIEAPLGPTLVVAGAGSGKTETMAGRVVWLVANRIVRRDEILGLTFTRKAAGELSERIDRRLSRIDQLAREGRIGELSADAAGEDALLRPRVSTYNAFADAIVREHGARIGTDPDAALLSTSASWLLARRVVVASQDARLSAREDRFGTIVDALQRLAGEFLDHGADGDAVAQFGNVWASAIAPACNRALAQPGAIERFHTAMTALPILADLVDQYRSAKAAAGAVDFADQVAGALAIVAGAPEVVDELRRHYRVVLLDEYQDTSVQQSRLLSTLFADSAVMAVGDPHQSIYGWRGASAANLVSFARAFSPSGRCAHFALMTSWRNDAAVLDAANAVIGAQHVEGIAIPPLQARPSAGAGRVRQRFAATIEDEAIEVADFFAQVRGRHRGEAPHSGAILFRAKRHMTVFADALAARGIPHRILGLGGLLSTPEVVDVVAALRVLSDPSQGSSLIRLLVGPRFGVGLGDLAALRGLAARLPRVDAAFGELPEAVQERVRASVGPEEQLSLVDALDVLARLRPGSPFTRHFSVEGLDRLGEAAGVFHRLRAVTAGSIPDVIRAIERELRLDIELAANESRGPARTSTAQLRSFLDEIQTFLAADERGTLASLLAWLDHAEETDELMPRTEPPEPGVVQLLTIHGSKGLEWDAVAVVRMVGDELPKRPRSTQGWLGYGSLPYAFRGDRDALPVLDWSPDRDPVRKDLSAAVSDFASQMKHHLESEERRLAYVAVTRARNELLLTGSRWGGQRKPRDPSPYLVEIVDALGLPAISVPDDEDNPYEGREGVPVEWPMAPLGGRTERVHDAARLVEEAMERDTASPLVAAPDIARLLDERSARSSRRQAEDPRRVAASRFKEFVADYARAQASVERPMPEKPYRATTLGTRFHAWVEARSGLAGSTSPLDDLLWEQDDAEVDSSPVADAEEAALAALQERFIASEWGMLSPLEVECEIDIRLPGAEGIDRLICKLDAVYRRSGRIEIVDWKTGAAPRTASERADRMLQLALYRVAYHKRSGIPLDQIDVVLYYVASDTVIRSDRVYSEEELVHLWNAARAARAGSSDSGSMSPNDESTVPS